MQIFTSVIFVGEFMDFLNGYAGVLRYSCWYTVYDKRTGERSLLICVIFRKDSAIEGLESHNQ